MAYKRNIGVADRVFFDTDRDLEFPVYDGNPTPAAVAAGIVTPVDATGWALEFQMRTQVDTPDPPLIEKLSTGSPPAITLAGTFDVDPAVNTQRIVVHLDDTDTYNSGVSPAVEIDAGRYYYALKRIDSGFETVIAYGSFRLQRTAAWDTP